MALAENQGDHQRKLESRAQVYTFVIAMTALVGGIVLIALDKNVGGLIALVSAIAGLGGLFAYSEVQRRRERKRASEAVQPSHNRT